MTLRAILTMQGMKQNEITVPKSISISDKQFKKIGTFRENGSWNHSQLIEELGNSWSDLIKGDGEVSVSELHLDPKRLYIKDELKNVFRRPENENEILDIPLELLASGGAIAQLTVSGFSNDYTPSIAININNKGEELAIGLEVKICNNFTILNAGSIMNTWEKIDGAQGGKTQLNLPMIKKIMLQKMQETKSRFERDLSTVENLQKTEISRNQFNAFLGENFVHVERANAYRVTKRIGQLTESQKQLTMTARQLAQFAVESADPSYGVYKWDKETTNKWKILNWATEILKIKHGSDIMSVLKTNENFTKKLLEYNFK